MLSPASVARLETSAPARESSVLSFRSISKRFGTIQANDDISFDIESGGIHAVVGENGAGKSTLTKILYGYYGPDSGSIHLNERKIVLNSPSHARRLGIGMVHQQLALVPSLTGFENVVLGDPSLPFLLNKGSLEKRIREKAHAYGFTFDLLSPVSELSVAERQKLEIFKLLWRDAHVLILDEPTSQLTPFEAEEVLTIVEGLAAAGRIVIFITHHIPEVMRFAGRITVLRKGKCITTVDVDSINSDELARLMVNSNELMDVKTGTAAAKSSSPLLSLRSISVGDNAKGHALREIELDIHAGEIIGIAGISGSGQTELGQVIAGLLKPTGGEIVWSSSRRTQPNLSKVTEKATESVGTEKSKATKGGQETGKPKALKWTHETMTTEWTNKICYIPSDQKQAYAPALSVAANGFLKRVNRSSSHRLGFLKGSLIDDHAKQLIESFQICPPIPDVPAASLSGGNLQRLIIGRELSTEAQVVVADNPCAGLDAAMAARVRQELRRAADTGRGIVLISPNLEELLTTCDRIIVMFNGRINGEQKSGQFDYHGLALMMGGKQ